jgi:hypothetical protein
VSPDNCPTIHAESARGFPPKNIRRSSRCCIGCIFFGGRYISEWQSYCSRIHMTDIALFQIYTVSKDGPVFTWKAKDTSDDENSDDEGPIASTSKTIETDVINRIANTRWGVHKRHYFNQLVSSTFHAPSNLLVVGFSTGVDDFYRLLPSEIA